MKQDFDFSLYENVASKEDCRAIIRSERWPDGFVCPRCKHTHGYALKTRDAIECAKCGRQTSSTAGTTFHGIQKLVPFFKMMTDFSQGKHVSAAEYAREYEIDPGTAWSHLHKIRSVVAAESGITECVDIPCTLLAPALLKKAKDDVLEGAVSAEPEEIISITIMETVDSPIQNFQNEMVHSVVAFLLSVYRGISRKYSQLYLAEFNWIIRKRVSGIRDFLTMCIRGKPYFRGEITDYCSPFLVRLIRTEFTVSPQSPLTNIRTF
jgi:hypothetical protein